MLSFRTGDLFESDADVLVNTVNCVGVMGAGVALAFKTKYPEMFLDYKKECRKKRLQPGVLHVWDAPSGISVVNFPTKIHWRDPSRYEYIEAGLAALHKYLSERGRVRVAIPALGCGHGGLEWSRVSELIRGHLSDLSADIEVFDPSFSRSVGREAVRKSVEGQSKQPNLIGVEAIEPGDSRFPNILRGVIETTIYAKGKLDVLDRPLVAVLPSPKPSVTEVEAALACVRAITDPSITLLVGYGAGVERPAIRIALEHGASVAICMAEGLANFRVRRDLQNVWDDRRILVFSAMEADKRWSHAAALKVRGLELAVARIVLISDPSPTWIERTLAKARSGSFASRFYISYQTQTSGVRQLLDSIKISPISKSARTGLPNVTRIVQSIGAGPDSDAD